MSADDPGRVSPENLPFESLDGAADDATVFQCPLCAARFTHGLQSCPSCPVNAGCALVTCPNCHYAYPRESKVVGWLKRLVKPRRAT